MWKNGQKIEFGSRVQSLILYSLFKTVLNYILNFFFEMPVWLMLVVPEHHEHQKPEEHEEQEQQQEEGGDGPGGGQQGRRAHRRGEPLAQGAQQHRQQRGGQVHG